MKPESGKRKAESASVDWALVLYFTALVAVVVCTALEVARQSRVRPAEPVVITNGRHVAP